MTSCPVSSLKPSIAMRWRGDDSFSFPRKLKLKHRTDRIQAPRDLVGWLQKPHTQLQPRLFFRAENLKCQSRKCTPLRTKQIVIFTSRQKRNDRTRMALRGDSENEESTQDSPEQELSSSDLSRWWKSEVPKGVQPTGNPGFAGAYEREVIHREILRRLDYVGAEDKTQFYTVRSECDSFRTDFIDDHGSGNTLALEDENYFQTETELQEQKRYPEGLVLGQVHSLKKRRVPQRARGEQGRRLARRNVLNHCIPAILERLGFKLCPILFAGTQSHDSLNYNVNVTVSYELSYMLATDGSNRLNKNEFAKFEGGVSNQGVSPGQLSTGFRRRGRTHSQPLNCLTSPKANSSFRPVSYVDAHNFRLSRKSTSRRKFWSRADSGSRSPFWKDLFRIIGLSAFVIVGTYAFAMSHRYLKSGASRKTPSVSMGTRTQCSSDPQSTAPLSKPATVVELTNCNFADAIQKSSRPTFVLFYAPWCTHCQQLESTWKELAGRLPMKGYDVQLAQMDAEKFSQIAEKFKVVKYPTLIFFKEGKPTDSHTGPRDVDSLMTFIDENYL